MVVAAIRLILIILAITPFWVIAQENNDAKLPKKYNIDAVEIDLIGSYYQQDGVHSAVEGGDGDQYLYDLSSTLNFNIPIDSIHIINGSFSFDTYTSASSTMIDWETVSSASYSDVRTYGHLNYTRLLPNNHALSAGGGISSEYDVFSHSYNLGWQKSFDNENHTIGFDLNALFDNWELIYPVEFRSDFETQGGLSTHLRNTFGATASYTGVVNRKMQSQLIYSFTYQSGLLSTPFHRVYFDTTGTNVLIIEGNEVFGNVKRNPTVGKDIERLPNSRTKHAIGLRNSNYISNWLILRTFYRFYFDNFGMTAHTASIEMPIKPNRFLSVYPFYRFHTQTAIDYFYPFLKADRTAQYYTSDYDLSGLTSHKYGLGLKISPAFGLYTVRGKPFANRTSSFKSIDLRMARYQRSDHLSAFMASTTLSFSF